MIDNRLMAEMEFRISKCRFKNIMICNCNFKFPKHDRCSNYVNLFPVQNRPKGRDFPCFTHTNMHAKAFSNYLPLSLSWSRV